LTDTIFFDIKKLFKNCPERGFLNGMKDLERTLRIFFSAAALYGALAFEPESTRSERSNALPSPTIRKALTPPVNNNEENNVVVIFPTPDVSPTKVSPTKEIPTRNPTVVPEPTPTPLEIINTLNYFLPSFDHQVETCRDNGKGGCDLVSGEYISNLVIGNNLFKVKWREPKAYERYTWDNDYIYLRFDGTWGKSNDPYRCNGQSEQYSFTNGIFAKVNMRVGEIISVRDNQVVMYRNGTCQECNRNINTYSITLEAHYPQYNLGGELGTQDVIVLRYNYGLNPQGKDYEKFFLAKGWGYVGWQYFENGIKKSEVFQNRVSGNNPVFPSRGCGDIPLPCSQLDMPRNLKYHCFLDGDNTLKVALSWDYAPGTSFYALRVDDVSTGGWNSSCNASRGDFCKNEVNTFYTFPVVPGHQYWWWLHSVNSCGQWSEAAVGQFACSLQSR